MRDLFLQLGINPDASPEETEAAIIAAIENKPQLAAASEVLLNAQRRAAYQRTVSTLRSIGTLRHRLGLDNDASWFLDTCPDFTPRMQSRKYAAKSEAESAIPAVAEPGVPTPAASGTTAASKVPNAGPQSWLKPLLIVVGIAAVLVLLYSVL